MKHNIEWHEKCLQNIRKKSGNLSDKISELTEEIEELEDEIFFYHFQIGIAKSEKLKQFNKDTYYIEEK